MAKLKLSQVPVGSIYIDNSSTFATSTDGNHTIPQWIVVGQDADGEGITTLIMSRSTSIGIRAFDAKEPTNPNEDIRNQGNPLYSVSNILQYLNSEGQANQWYSPQHEYDQSPITPYINIEEGKSRYQEYAKIDGFLHSFSDDLKNAMISVEKYGVNKKVHLPSYKEITPNGWVNDSVENKANHDENGIAYKSYVVGDGNDISFLVRGDGNPEAPKVIFYVNTSKVRKSSSMPYTYGNSVIPMIFVDSNAPVSYDVTGQKYYSAWDNAPVISVNNNLGQHKTEFSFNFSVSDADGDTVSVSAYVDDSETAIFNNTVSLDTPTQITVPASVMSGLEYGNHTVKIVADDGDKTSTAIPIFEKYDIAPTVSVQSDLGQKKYTFNFTFRISDADDTKSSVTVKLDNTQIYSDNNAPLDTDITIQISTSDFSALTYDTHTLMITADDGVKTGMAMASFQKIELSVPVITADEIGNKASEFTSTYQVSSDSADSIDVIVKLDNVEIDNKTNVAQDTDIILAVSASRFNALSYGNHEIDIIATDNDGYSSTKPLTFKKCSTPTVRMSVPVIVEEPFSVEVTANSADGDNITLKAYIDNREINV